MIGDIENLIFIGCQFYFSDGQSNFHVHFSPLENNENLQTQYCEIFVKQNNVLVWTFKRIVTMGNNTAKQLVIEYRNK